MTHPAATLPPIAASPTGVAAEHARLEKATRDAFVAYSAAKQRHPHDVGISSVGGCRRALALALAKVPPSDEQGPGENRAANLGTMQHAGYLPVLAAQLPGARIEVPVTLRAGGLTLPGHIDLADATTVVDLKTVGEHRLQGALYHGAAYFHHRLQVGGYALARLQADPAAAPSYVAWLYLDRANGDMYLIVEEFTTELALAVIDRMTEIAFYVNEDPMLAPPDERGPGLSIVCDQCPFLTACCGPMAVAGRTGAQAIRPVDGDWAPRVAQIQDALLDYLEGHELETAGKDRKADAVAKLQGVPTGIYGAAKYGYTKPQPDKIDTGEAVAKLRRLGLEVPTKYQRGSLAIKLVGPNPRREGIPA